MALKAGSKSIYPIFKDINGGLVASTQKVIILRVKSTKDKMDGIPLSVPRQFSNTSSVRSCQIILWNKWSNKNEKDKTLFGIQKKRPADQCLFECQLNQEKNGLTVVWLMFYILI